MRELKIKMWDLNVDYDLVKIPTKPISFICWISDEAMKELGVEGFKKVARKQFEKMLETWEKENAE